MVDKREHTMNTAILLRQSLWDREDKRNWYIDGCNCDQTANDANDEEEEEKEEESSTSSSPNRRVTVIKKINFSNHDPDKYFCTSTFFSEKFKVPSTDKRVSMMDRYTFANYCVVHCITHSGEKSTSLNDGSLHEQLHSHTIHIAPHSSVLNNYENIRIHKYRNTQNIRMRKYTNTQNIRIRKFTNTQNIRIHKPKVYIAPHISVLHFIVVHCIAVKKCYTVALMSHVLVCTAVRKCYSLAVMSLVNAAFHCRNVAHCIALQ